MFPLLFRDKRTRPDIKVMIILPQGTFRIVKENVFLSRIVLLIGFLKLCTILNCEKIGIHGYIVKNHESDPSISCEVDPSFVPKKNGSS